MRASFEMPKTSLFGMYAMAICEWGCVVVRHAVSSWAKSPGLGGDFWARRTNLASERDQMVFAEARNVDFANQDHFVMVFRKDSIIDHV